MFPALAALGERDISSAWSGRVFYTLDDYPFVERRHGGRVVTFAAPSDHGNSLALRIGQLVGNIVGPSALQPRSDDDIRQRRRNGRQLRAVRKLPEGTAPAAGQALPGSRISRDRSSRPGASAGDIRP